MRVPTAILSLIVVAMFLLVPASTVDAEEATEGTGPVEIDGDMEVTASGDCSESGRWYYERSSNVSKLTLSGGYVPKLSDGKWTLEALTIDSEKVEGTDLAEYTAEDVIIKENMNLTIGKGVTAADGAMRDLRPSKLAFGDGFTSIPGGMFSNCSTLHSVDMGKVESIGAEAFKGCGLSTIDVKLAAVDHKAFNGCNNLKEIKATDSTHYRSVNGMLYTKDGRTLYMVPTGLSGIVGTGEMSLGLETVNLSYANAIIAVDNLGRSTPVTFVDVIDGAKTRGISYSSLGMKDHRLIIQTDDVVLNYTLYEGWAVDAGSVSCTGAGHTLYPSSLKVSDFRHCTILPMGVCTMTYTDIANMKELDGWSVKVVDAPAGTGIAKDLDHVGVQVDGYMGEETSATLSGTMVHNGIICSIESIGMASGSLGKLEDLTVGEGIEIGKDAFANARYLRSVTADHVDSLGEGAFRYCTSLEEASFRSCKVFGDRAFEMCWGLNNLNLVSDSVSFGKDTFAGCIELDVITVAYGTTLNGVPSGVSIVRYDPVATPDIGFEAEGDLLIIQNDFSDHVLCSKDPEFTTTERYDFYYDDRTIVPMYPEMYIKVVAGVGVSGYTVAFDPGLGQDVDFVTVPYGGKVTDRDPDSPFGYHFLGWYLDGYEYDFTETVDRCIVLTGEWAKEDAIDPTPMYLLVILAVAMGASIAVIGLARREIKRY